MSTLPTLCITGKLDWSPIFMQIWKESIHHENKRRMVECSEFHMSMIYEHYVTRNQNPGRTGTTQFSTLATNV